MPTEGTNALPLPAEVVHVWYVFTDEARAPELLERYQSLVSPAESTQRQRFAFERDRHQYLVTRVLIRTLLSRYFPVPPTSWTFRANAHGKPAIAGPAGLPPLEFNLSHTRGLIACAVTLGREVGIDVEDVERREVSRDLARRYFAPCEADHLDTLAAADRRRTFFDYWTLKEAYIKARGLGLALPLDRFSFHFDVAGPPRIAFAPELPDDPCSWQFFQHRPSASHQMALAVHIGSGPPLLVETRRTIPLVDEAAGDACVSQG